MSLFCQVKALLKVQQGGGNFSLLQHIYNTTSSEETRGQAAPASLDTCLAVVSPLFPRGVTSRTLSHVLNMSQSKATSHKMNNALQKYWGGVDKTYRKLSKKYDHDDDDDEDDWYMKRHAAVQPQFYPQGPRMVGQSRQDWYMNRRPLTGKGEYSYVSKDRKQSKKDKKSDKKYKHSKSSKKGEIDCRMFDCVNSIPTHFGFELCGC